MNFYEAPPLLTASVFSQVPHSLWSLKKTDWIPGSGIAPPIFLEGPTTDAKGHLYVVDVAFGRILRCHLSSGDWSVLADYDGEPNGMALDASGNLIVADYKNGMLKCVVATGTVTALLARRNMERFKGPNDVIVSSSGDIYFTDQGQTGMSDQSGHVYRLSVGGKLDTLIANGASPNGLVLSPNEKVLYVAMTRENSVWRCPLHADGTTTKVGKFFQSFGIAGPDGLTVDSEGNVFICHPSLLSIFVVTPHGVPLCRILLPEGHGTSLTNCIFGNTPVDRNRLYITDSTVGRICYVDWHCDGLKSPCSIS